MDSITALIFGGTAVAISGITAYAMTKPVPLEKICIQECKNIYQPYEHATTSYTGDKYMRCIHDCLDKKPKQVFLEEP
jgi:hypothetical protein